LIGAIAGVATLIGALAVWVYAKTKPLVWWVDSIHKLTVYNLPELVSKKIVEYIAFEFYYGDDEWTGTKPAYLIITAERGNILGKSWQETIDYATSIGATVKEAYRITVKYVRVDIGYAYRVDAILHFYVQPI